MNISDVLNQEGKVIESKQPLGFEEFRGEKIQKEPEVSLVLTNLGKGKASIRGKAQLEFIFPCDRCLTPVPTTVELKFTREVFAPETVTDEEILEDQHFLNGYELDAEALIKEELELNWPAKILCREDCKGICKKCGQNRNEGSCDCDDFVPDPRLANLMDIFNNSQ